MKKIAILISGRGSNASAIIRGQDWGYFNGEVVGVFSDKKDPPGFSHPNVKGIRTASVDPSKCHDRDELDSHMSDLIESVDADLVVLAGFMRILGDRFVRKYAGRCINIHPSLLPKYKGLDTHARAIANGDREAGATIHYVNEELDGGEIIERVRVPIFSDDTPETLQQRVLDQEHMLYLQVLQKLCRE